MISIEEKREILGRYRLQQAKINRLKEQGKINTDRKSKYEKEILKAKSIRDAIENSIENISDETESEILAQKYLCGRSLEETAELLNYSKRQVERLHIKALEHFIIDRKDFLNGTGNTSLRS